VPKHLVLDEDVHRELKKKKKETGLNVKDIGNSILRSLLERPLVLDILGKRLVESGKLTAKEFDRLRHEVLLEAASPASGVDQLIHPTNHATLTSGSWELQELFAADDDSFHVLSAWAKDRRSRPFPSHRHKGDEFFIVLTGKLLVTVEGEPLIVSSPGCHYVPKGASHSSTPLEPNTYVLVVLSPPEESYRSGAS